MELLSISRRPAGLIALVSKRGGIVRVPFEQLTDDVCPNRKRLAEAWRFLASVKAADASALFHVSVVLLETVPESTVQDLAPLPPEWAGPPEPPRATRAHPRAFQGTKYQPPKARRLPAVDVRPHLCSPGSLRTLLAPMQRFAPEVRARLSKAGYHDAAVEAAESNAPWKLPSRFVHHIWPRLRSSPARDVSRHLALFTKLDTDDRMLGLFARLVALSEHAYAWGLDCETLAPERRAVFLETLLRTRAYAVAPQPGVAEVSALALDEQYPAWVEQFLVTVRRGTPVDYLLAGFRLAVQFAPERTFDCKGYCANVPEQLIEEIALQSENPFWCATTLWERCGQHPGFDAALRNSQWRSLAPKAADAYFEMLVGFRYCDLTERALQRKWAAIAEGLPRLEAFVLETPPEYQCAALRYLGRWLSWWDDPVRIRDRLPIAYRLLRRVAAFPFGELPDRALESFLQVKDTRFLDAPNSSFEALKKAFRRGNDGNLTARGLDSLARHEGSLMAQTFLEAPGKLFRTAKALGTASSPAQDEILRACAAHPLFHLDPTNMPVRQACLEIAEACEGGGASNPIPARLSAWVRGEIELTEARVQRYASVMSDRMLATRLGLIALAAADHLKRGLPETTDEHALRVMGWADENRRGLRKFLKAHGAGNHDYLVRHPATVEWYRRHPAVDRGVWENGVQFDKEGIRIEVERDPFEMLKLGTYVGSCLGVGGWFTYSAIAVLLDANKQVLYARDHRGRVVARQLVAISDDDRLVCFHVYPAGLGEHKRALFREYDLAWAKALGLPVYKWTEEGYCVSSTLSNRWYDDGIWEVNKKSQL